MTFAISTLKQPSFITKRDTKKTRFYASLINFHGLTTPIFWQSDRKELSLPSDFRFQFKRRSGLTRERERRWERGFSGTRAFFWGKSKKAWKKRETRWVFFAKNILRRRKNFVLSRWQSPPRFLLSTAYQGGTFILYRHEVFQTTSHLRAANRLAERPRACHHWWKTSPKRY